MDSVSGDKEPPVIDEVEVVVGAGAELGEAPVWDAERQTLIWVDIPVGQVHRYRPDGEDTVVTTLDMPVGAAAVRAGGGLVLAAGRGFVLYDEDLDRHAWLVTVDHGTRMNDAKCDPSGRFWAGTLVDEASPGQAGLYRLDPDHSVRLMLESVTLSNGLGWSPDCQTMYYIDTPARRIDALDFDLSTGSISNRRLFVDLHDVRGRPDGLTVDAAGGLWVAMANGWVIRRYDENGVLDEVIRLPVQKVTSCTFGGADLGDLYITTGRTGLAADAAASQPLAGAVFRCRPGVTGLPPNTFHG